ncbi:MAG: hypothetical protein II621_03565 [Clostridia bacterium]|nr:hypothetical protein [Clostridia bacterium]
MTYLTRMVAFLITVFLGLFSVVGTPTWKREAPLRVAAYIVVSDVEAAKALDDSHLDDLTDIILIGNTGWFGTDGKLHMAEAFGDVAAWFRARTAKNHTRLLVTIGGPGASEGTDVTERFESQAANHKLAFDSGVLETEIRQMLETYALDGVNFDYEFPGTPQREKEFSAFLVSLDKVLKDDYLITAALSSGWCKNTTPEAIAALDTVQLMDYDLWDRTGAHATLGIGKGCVEEMLETGFSKEQIDLGLAFYARPTTQEAYWYDYKEYYKTMDRYGFAPDEAHGLTASFNTPRETYLKTLWAKRNGLGGVFVWHYACDVPADNCASLFNQVMRAKNGLLRAGR